MAQAQKRVSQITPTMPPKKSHRNHRCTPQCVAKNRSFWYFAVIDLLAMLEPLMWLDRRGLGLAIATNPIVRQPTNTLDRIRGACASRTVADAWSGTLLRQADCSDLEIPPQQFLAAVPKGFALGLFNYSDDLSNLSIQIAQHPCIFASRLIEFRRRIHHFRNVAPQVIYGIHSCNHRIKIGPKFQTC